MTALTLDDVIATFDARKVNINARHIPVGTYVLSWNNGLFVGMNQITKEGFATGFEHAAFFGDREAAEAFRTRTLIRNGADVRPSAVLAFNARQGALIELDKVIADVTARKEG
jgi:hypothetical protein